MYCSHFGLHRPPFNNTPDPSFYYSTPDHEEALATLQYATVNRKGFVLVTGEVGAGKTLIGRMFIRQIDRQASTAVITHTQLNARQLLAAICSEFELEMPPEATNLQLADLLQEYLLDQFARDRFVVVLLDEGQNLPDESFEALRMLGNLEADDAKLLQVCILGQPELRDRFRKEGMRQLDQRLFRRFHLPALNQQQTGEYIRRRLAIAGCVRADLFTPDAIARIFAGSGGIPRVINQVCDNALLAAYAQGRDTVEDAIVDQVFEQEGLTHPTGIDQVARGSVQGEAKDAPAAESLGTRETGFVAAQSTDEQTQARIERIYGTAPELVETEMPLPSPSPSAVAVAVAPASVEPYISHDGFGPPERSDAPSAFGLRDVVGGAAQQWPAVRQAIDDQRRQMQRMIENITVRCRQAEAQIDNVAATAAPAAELEELRQLHATETRRVLDEIARARAEIEQMVSHTETRLVETEGQLHTISSTALTREAIEAVERQQGRRIEEAITRFDQYRRHVDDLVQLLRHQCDQTQVGIGSLLESCAKMRVELNDRIDHKLGELHRQLQEQLQAVSPSGQIESLREAQAQTRMELASQFEARLAETQSHLQEHLRTAAKAADVEHIRQTTAKMADLEAVRQSMVKPADLEVVRQSMVKPADLEAVRQSMVKPADLEAVCQSMVKPADLEVVRRSMVKPADLEAALDTVNRNASAIKTDLETRLNQTSQEMQTRSRHSLRRLSKLREEQQQHHASLRQEIEQASTRQQGLLAEHKTIIDDLARGVVRCDGQIKALAQNAAARVAAVVSDLNELKAGSATVAQVDALRQEHLAAVTDIAGQLEGRSTELTNMKASLEELLALASREQAAGLQSLSVRLDEESDQVRQLRQRMVETHATLHDRLTTLQEECVTRSDLERLQQSQAEQAENLVEEIQADRIKLDQLRQAQADQAAQVAQEIQDGRLAVHRLIDGLTERLATAQERLDVLTRFAKSDSEKLGELGRTQAEDVSSILQQLEDQRRTTEERFEQTLADWTRTQQSLEDLRATAANADALDELRAVQNRHSSEIRQAIAEQQQALETLVRAVDQRCDTVMARLDALPADIATADDVREVHARHETDQAAAQAAIHSVAEQCERTAAALSGLEDRSASRNEVQDLREAQARSLHEVLARLESQDTGYQQEFDALNCRWESVRDELRQLARSSTSVEKFEAAERLITEDLGTLKQQIEDVTSRRSKDVRILVDIAQRLTDRIKALEEEERPEPVRIELQPQVAQELAELKKAAEQQASELRNLLGGAGSMGDQFRASSAQIEQVMRDWLANVDAVQQQSDELRESAQMSAGVIQAIRKCHEAVDTKLKSKRWQTALKTSDQIASRLEKATGSACTAATQIQTTLKNCEQVRGTIETQIQTTVRTAATQIQTALKNYEQVRGTIETRIQTALENCEEVRDTVESAAEHHNEARKIASALSRLVTEAKNAEGRLGQMTHRVGSIADGIAQKTAGLADLLGAVRELDEQQHPTGQPGHGPKPAGVISPAIWPKYRTHNVARAV